MSNTRISKLATVVRRWFIVASALAGLTSVPLVAQEARRPDQQLASKVTDSAAKREAEKRAVWRRAITEAGLPKNGCFTASYPETGWHEIPCGTSRHQPHVPRPRGPDTESPESVGAGVDYVAHAAGALAWAEGSFVTVAGAVQVASTASSAAGQLQIGDYGLQLNTNPFITQAVQNICIYCQGWEQFVYSTRGCSNGPCLAIQIWLIDGAYFSTCPPQTPIQYGNDCYTDSVAIPIPDQPVSELASLTLTAATIHGQDIAVLGTPGGLLRAIGTDSILGLGEQRVWRDAEFNIFGECCGETAEFHYQAALIAQVEVGYQDRSGFERPPFCAQGGWSGESNSLSLDTCCSFPAGAGRRPSIQFLETNDKCIVGRCGSNNLEAKPARGASILSCPWTPTIWP